MPKFNVSAEFSLRTVVEYEGYGDIGGSDEALDYEDRSSFGSDDVEVDGGHVTFVVEADDDDQARFRAEEIIADGWEVTDGNGLTWEVTNTSYEIEADEMTRDEAFVIVRRLLDRLVAENHITSEEREALDLVIQDS